MAKRKATTKKIKFISYLLFAILFLFPFGQLTQIPFLPGPRVYLHDILIIFLWPFLAFLSNLKEFKNNALFFPIVLFILAGIVSLIFSLFSLPINEVLTASLYLIRWIAYLAVAPATMFLIQRKPKFKQKIIKSLIFAGSLASIFGLAQYVLYPDLRNLYYLGWDPHYLRLFGTFFDPNFLGLVIVLTLITTITSLNNSWLKFSLLFINTLALALTYSRSSFLALGVALCALFIIKKQLNKILLLFVIGLFAIILLPKGPQSEGIQLQRIASVEGRLESITRGKDLFSKSPLFGLGFNTLRYYQPTKMQTFNNQIIPNNSASGIENSYVFLLATTGIVGFTAYMILLGKIFIFGNRIIKISLIAILVNSLFNNSLFYPWIMIWIWFMVGILPSLQSK